MQETAQAPSSPSQPASPTYLPRFSPPKLLIIQAVITTLLSCLLFYLFYQNQQLKQLMAQPSVPAVTPTPNLSDLKTHSLSSYQVSYPNDVNLAEDQGSVTRLYKWGPTQKEGTELYDGFSISFEPREIPNATLNEYVSVKIDEIKRQVGIVELLSGPSPITLGGYTGFSYTIRGLGDYQIIILESPSKTYFMEMSILVSDPGGSAFQSTVDQILSTFKFIANSPTPPPVSKMIIKYSPVSTWQTYTDSVSGYSIQYNDQPTPPYNYSVEVAKNQPGTFVTCHIATSGEFANKKICPNWFTIKTYTDYDNGSRRDWWTKKFPPDSTCPNYYQDLTIGGKNALMGTNDCASWGSTFYLIPKNASTMVVISMYGYARNNKTGEISVNKDFLPILSTFKFSN